MKKKHPKHHRPAEFVSEGEKMTMPVVTEQRMLTAEGYRRRSLAGCPAPRSRSLYRGRRQGKGS